MQYWQQLKKADWRVRTVENKERRKSATAPFTTSKLQQDASRQLGFSVKRTMGVAQRLYEGVDIGPEGTVGLITYMRTDSMRVSPDAIAAVREYIGKQAGQAVSASAAERVQVKEGRAGRARSHSPDQRGVHPDEIRRHLSEEQYKLYRLIWQRFVASQIVPAIFDQTTVDIEAKADRSYDFRVTGSVLKFDGFLRVYEEAKDAKDEDDEALKNKLPALTDGQKLKLNSTLPEQHFTEPLPRYNEASLVKVLEERGIGRPSTYSSIITTIQDRKYVTKVPPTGRAGRFYPTEIGVVVNDLLVANFPYIFDTAYTARLEEELDEIEEGNEKWTDLLGGFYGHFEEELTEAGTHMENVKRWEKPTDQKCEVCGSPLVMKWGKFGSFFACSAYDKKKKDSCTFTKENFEGKPELNSAEGAEGEQAEEYCEACGRVMVLRSGRFGAFMACPGYNEDPPCKTTRKLDQKVQQKPPVPLDEYCPKCGEQLVLRNGQYGEFVSCSGYPKCKYIKQNLVEGMTCPKCGKGDIAERKTRFGTMFYGCTNYPKCDFSVNSKPVPTPCKECGSPYLIEKTLKSGIYLTCPNNKKPAAVDDAPSKRKKKGKEPEVEAEGAISCSFSKRIGDAPAAPAPEPKAKPTAKTHGPIVEDAHPVPVS